MSNFFVVVSSCLVLYLFFFLSMVMGLKGGNSGVLLDFEWEISEKFLMELSFPLVLDLVSCLFMVTVFFISGSVMLFTGFYMSHEVFFCRFVVLVLLFVLSMIMLILFPNFLSMMVGWDGLGVVSFLLVVYYMNSDSLSAGMITAISNRVGDVFFVLMIGVMSCLMSFSFSSCYFWFLSVMGILVLLGSMTKSAQIPFSAWLPEAMAAPTPVSTLVHSSTLVTAGVYVLIRFSGLLSEVSYYLLMGFSMMTVIMAGSSGVGEVDMKKVVALSTLSQVGMMMFAISVGAIMVSFFHLVVHAFFKALMFMCVGGVIFYSGGVQDGRFLSGLWVKMPFTCSLLLLANLSLMGFPFLSGFYSKELILAVYLLGSSSVVGFVFLFLSLVFTMAYGFRMMLMMMSYNESYPVSHYSVKNVYYLASLVVMSNGAVAVGVIIQMLMKDMVFFVNMAVSAFYGGLVLSLVWFFNVLVLLLLQDNNSFKITLKSMLSGMWFLKDMSGNMLSSVSLVLISRFVSLVEMGWIRSYVWSGGLKASVFGVSSSVRKVNFSSIGFLTCLCLCFWVVLIM